MGSKVLINNRNYFLFWLLGLLLIAALFVALKTFTLHPYLGDEHTYNYQAKLVTEGFVPYRDFAMAHPPGQTLFTALVFKLAGSDLLVGRLLPLFWSLSGGLLLATLMRRSFGGFASLFALSLYWFSFEPLRVSSHYVGVNMTLTLLIAATLAVQTKAFRTAAVIAVFAVFTRFYAIPSVVLLALYALYLDPRKGIRAVYLAAILGLCVSALTALWCGFENTLDNLVTFHFQKAAMSATELVHRQINVLIHNSAIAVLFVLSLLSQIGYGVVSFLKHKEAQGSWTQWMAHIKTEPFALAILASAICCTYILILVQMKNVWQYYYLLAFPFAAISCAWLIQRWSSGLTSLIAARGNLRKACVSLTAVIWGISLPFTWWFAGQATGLLEKKLPYYAIMMKRAPEDRGASYEWVDSPLPDTLNKLIRDLFWHDKRFLGQDYPSITYYLWHESRIFDIADEVTAVIREHTTPDGEIFGDAGTVPFFALSANRAIAAHAVDTNIQQFRSGHVDPQELIARIDHPNTQLIILRRKLGVATLPSVRHLVRRKYKRILKTRTKTGAVFYVFKRKAPTT